MNQLQPSTRTQIITVIAVVTGAYAVRRGLDLLHEFTDRRILGLAAAFVFGLCLDVHQAALLGQHALAYSALSFAAIALQRRILWLPVLAQALQLLPLFALSYALITLVRLIAGGVAPGWLTLLAPLLEAALWPVLTWLLLAPQRRAPNPDADRPF